MTPRVHTLANGVRVICDPMPGLESAALSVVVGAGARWETPAVAGWSHLLEHMVFKGAGDRSARDIVEAIEAEGGQINAATGYERTSFQVRCLKDGLPLGMAVIADLIRRPVLSPAELEREKQVVGQEIAEAADAPDDRVFELAQEKAFADQPLGRPILGTTGSIGTATRDTLDAFHNGLYAPDRIVISAAGAVDEDALLAMAEQAFGDARAPDQPLGEPAEAAFTGGVGVETRALEQAQLVLLLPAPGTRDPDFFVLRLFAEILGGGMSSRLFQHLREERGLAYAIDAYADTYGDVGLLGVYAGTAAKDAVETARLAAEEIKRLAAHVEPAELARAKAQAKAQLFMSRESPLARAEQAAGQVILFGRPFEQADLAASIDAVGEADFRRIGERVLDGARSAAAVLGPKRAGKAAEAFAKAVAAG